MSSTGAAPCAAVPTSSARAEASRRNGAKSRGPKTPEGKARSARNALKHGLRGQKYVVLPDEDATEFAALEAALIEELAPQGVLQTVLAGRIARAAWRLERAERLEVELFEERHIPTGTRGLALIRDGNSTRSFETLLRYRGAALAELWRALRTLKALQAEEAAIGLSADRHSQPARTTPTPRGRISAQTPDQPEVRRNPSKPKAASNPKEPKRPNPIKDFTRERSAAPRPDTPDRSRPDARPAAATLAGTKPTRGAPHRCLNQPAPRASAA